MRRTLFRPSRRGLCERARAYGQVCACLAGGLGGAVSTGRRVAQRTLPALVRSGGDRPRWAVTGRTNSGATGAPAAFDIPERPPDLACARTGATCGHGPPGRADCARHLLARSSFSQVASARPTGYRPRAASRSSRGLGHQPFTLVTRVRIPYGTPLPSTKPLISVALSPRMRDGSHNSSHTRRSLAPNLARGLRRALASATGLRGVGSRPPSDHSAEREDVSARSVLRVTKTNSSFLSPPSPSPEAERVRNRRAPQLRLEGPTAASAPRRYKRGVAAPPPEHPRAARRARAGRLGQPPLAPAISAADSRAIAPATRDRPSGS